jgi:uncharacterized membrane protein
MANRKTAGNGDVNAAREKTGRHPQQKHTNRQAQNDAIIIITAAVAANILSLIAIKGPWNISFSLTAVPILLAAFTRGWKAGAFAGLLGGIIQAQEYGSLWYVLYTLTIGLVAGYMAERPLTLRPLAPVTAAFGGFLIFWFTDVTTLEGKLPETFLQALSIPPYRAIAAFMAFAIGTHLLVRHSSMAKNSFITIALAGLTGAVAYAPYDILVMLAVQGYHIAPALVVLSKDLIQDITAALLCGLLLQNQFLREKLGVQ